VRILVTNDDGIISDGLAVLARRLTELGEVLVVAPAGEWSGASMALGSLEGAGLPRVRDARIPGVDRAYAVDGPPGSCVLLARFEAFGPLPDLVVSGINLGANTGRSVYHSGTVGAAVTARLGHINALAVSQVSGDPMHWEVAAELGALAAEGLLTDPPDPAVVASLNVPNVTSLDEIRGLRTVGIANPPLHRVASAELRPLPHREGEYKVVVEWPSPPGPQPETTDTGAVIAGYATLTWIGPLTPAPPAQRGAEQALIARLG